MCPMGLTWAPRSWLYRILSRKISRQIWSTYDLLKIMSPLKMGNENLNKFTPDCTGHGPKGVWRSCKNLGSKKTVEYFLCECWALARVRSKTLGQLFLKNISDRSRLSLNEPQRVFRFKMTKLCWLIATRPTNHYNQPIWIGISFS